MITHDFCTHDFSFLRKLSPIATVILEGMFEMLSTMDIA